MSYAEDFENLERANAQIDIWIDEEEYDKVIDACKIDEKLKTGGENKPCLKEILSGAFSDPICTAEKDKDDEWLSILNIGHSDCPISGIRDIPNKGHLINLTSGDQTSEDYSDWSHFFWAKLIRAKIQKKDTDCYYRRLDQVVAYLERHCPQIKPLKGKEGYEYQNALLSNILAVIYLLEMAAAGEAADQRSFAERARRVLIRLRNSPRNENIEKYYYDFYDLLARYNIGVGYFHERLYRKAVLEFNWIIDRLGNMDSVEQKLDPEFVKNRLGKDFLYLPAVLYRAEVQLKLQLAYHATYTISKHRINPTSYKEAYANLVRTELFQQMGNYEEGWAALRVVAEQKLGIILEQSDQVTILDCEEDEKYPNLRGKVQSLLADHYLQHLHNNEKDRPYLERLYQFFTKYKKCSMNKKSEREGYLQQLSKYLGWLGQKIERANQEGKIKKGKSIFIGMAKKVYADADNDTDATNSEMLGFDEEKPDNCFCPCKEKGIDLRRLNREPYEALTHNMRTFFKAMGISYTEQKKRFLQRLQKIEKEARDNLNWRQRDLKLELQDNRPNDWCNNCVPFVHKRWPIHFFRKRPGFDGLLGCAERSGKANTSNLIAADYEKIMDHWDDHFLEHMKSPSFHKPRCRSLHFLSLQRWNSTSPAQGRSLGGGYLLYHTDKKGCIDLGVAIDPGFDFVRNLFHVGFSLADIDVVLLSHAHVDHVRDFESMVTLLLELRKRTKNADKEVKRKIHAIMTLGVYRRFEYIIKSPGLREYIEPYILDIEKEIDADFLDKCKFEFVEERDQSDKPDKAEPSRNSNLVRFVPILPGENGEESSRDGSIHLTIAPTKAYHNDFSEYSDSFGFIINIKDPKKPQIDHTFGYTGDTSWYPKIMEQYYKNKPCDTLLVHLGSLIDREKPEWKEFKHYKTDNECFELIRKKNHPYLMGMLHFLTEIKEYKWEEKKPLIFMSEFGEELRGGIRLDFIDRLKKAYGTSLDVLPVDIGLDVLLAYDSLNCTDRSVGQRADSKTQVWCVQCKHFVRLGEVDFIYYGHDEALFCVCKTCKKATPVNVLQERLRALYEVGRRLETH